MIFYSLGGVTTVAEADLKEMEDAMSGACTMEVAALDEFVGLFQDEGSTEAGGFTAGCVSGVVFHYTVKHFKPYAGLYKMLARPRTACMLLATIMAC